MFICICRTIRAIILGLLVIPVFVESVEFALVTVANGRMTTDPELYFTIRNRSWILAMKVLYNAIGAVAGGYVAARMAGYAYRYHGIALASIQTLGFGWGLTQPEIRHTTPTWMWFVLIPLTAVGIIIGANYCGKQRNPSQ